MQTSTNFQLRLTARILAVLGAACLVAPESGCSGNAHPAGTSTGGATQSSSTTTKSGSAATGGAGGADGGGATDGAATDGAAMDDGAAGDGGAGDAADDGAGDASAMEVPSKVCLSWPVDPDAGADAGPCPTDAAEILADFEALGCPRGWEPSEIVSGPVAGSPDGQCCYMCEIQLCGPGGRPYLSGGEALVASVGKGDEADGWREGAAPRADGLGPEERARLAAAWTLDALHEHASVASFSRAALALLSAGAPADLVALTHQAALDEVRHAQRCFALASAYAGEALGPGRFPLGGSVMVPSTLAEIAVSAAEEGCVGETVAAMVAAEQLSRALDPAVRAALVEIAEDEARHAALAWQTVAWAVRTGGAEVRSAVAEAFSRAAVAARQAQEAAATDPAAPVMEAHGRLDAATVARVTAATLVNVVAPAVKALLQPEAKGARAEASSLRV